MAAGSARPLGRFLRGDPENMAISVLRFTFARPEPDPAEQSTVLQAALEMVKWGDAHGVTAATVDEHHVTDFGWSCNPILEGGCFLAATSKLFVSVMCALGPLWNPIRMAEDIAVVDQMSGGRLSVTVGLGYRPIEYAAIGADFSQRGRLMDDLLEVMLRAWTGEPFEHHGTTIRVTPMPLTRPHPPLFVGGSVKATARRAVRFRLPLNIPDHLPALKEYYEELCRAEGVQPEVQMASVDDLPSAFLHEDPDQAWAQLGRHFAWEAVNYGQWATAGMSSIMHLPGVHTIDEVRASGRYVILTPDELVARLRARGSGAVVSLYPLCGGMPIEEGWKSVHLLTDKVLPQLQ
jgi:alkanesulfonate monooxygenase SsuD/methylene tetrahydromethanopterin reductase-like flavin-dependent oxidoreductase (luciferase family)